MRLTPRYHYPYLPRDEDPVLEALRRLDPGADQTIPRDPQPVRSLAEAFEAPTPRRRSDPVAAFFGTPARAEPTYAATLPHAPVTLPFDSETYSYAASQPPYDARYSSDVEAQAQFQPIGPARRYMDARPELYPYVPPNDGHAGDPSGHGEWGINHLDAADRVELANSVGPPRYYVGTGGRILTPGEQLRWSNYKRAIEMIRELDPHAPRADLYSAPPSTWVPDYATDINPLWERFRELRTLLGRRDLERHHPESTQFAREFCDIFGIDGATRDLHSYYLPWREHRGVGGLHPYWNRDFIPFLGKARQGRMTQENLEDFLANQMHKYGQLLMP